jgi:hypothetical protein
MQARIIWMLMLFTTATVHADDAPLEVASHNDKLVITRQQKPVAEFVFRDEKVLRPFFANVHTPGGVKVTRNHPPQDGDATDHDTMHPGIWLAFGDINGHDFWRNKGHIEHVRFIVSPSADAERLTFVTESNLITADGKPVCRLVSQFALMSAPTHFLLVWDSTFYAEHGDITFGDQEEMGFGARVATGITEKNGGIITNAHGQKTAAKTWGQSTVWCDYSGTNGGISLVASPANFRESWWHNRDYGVFVANPFGRAAMKQGERSAVTVKRGETFRLKFAAIMHDAAGDQIDAAVKDALQSLK